MIYSRDGAYLYSSLFFYPSNLYAGKIIDSYGSKLPMVIGAIFLMIGTGLLLTYNEGSPILWLIIILILHGISNGFTNIASQTALYDYVKEKDTGSASGLYMTSRYMGSILSGSFLGLAYNRYLDFEQLHLVATVCLIICLFIVAISFRLSGEKDRSG